MLRKALFATLPAAIVAGVLGTAASAENGAVPDASEFNHIQRYAIAYDKPRDLAHFYLREAGFKKYDAEIEVVDDPANSDRRVIIMTVEPIANAQVKGMQWRFGIRSNARRWEAVEAGMRRKCVSGPNADQWTRDVCP